MLIRLLDALAALRRSPQVPSTPTARAARVSNGLPRTWREGFQHGRRLTAGNVDALNGVLAWLERWRGQSLDGLGETRESSEPDRETMRLFGESEDNSETLEH